MSHWTDSTPTDEMYLYDGSGAGFPIGYNPTGPLYAWRDTLRHFGVSSRTITDHGYAQFYFENPIPPGVLGTADAIDWINPRYPRLGVRLDRHCFAFCMHFWFSNLTARVRPATNDLWAVPPLRSLDPDTGIRSFTNTDFLGPWNQTAGPVDVAMADFGVCEFSGAALEDADDFPRVILSETMIDGQEGYLLENQGRCIPVTLRKPKSTPGLSGTLWTVELPAGCSLYGGDSGGPIVVIERGELCLWGHVYGAQSSYPHGNTPYPDAAALSGFGVTVGTVAKSVEWPIATAATAAALLANLLAIEDELP